MGSTTDGGGNMDESTGKQFIKLGRRSTILIFIVLAVWLILGVSVVLWAMLPRSEALASKAGLDLTILASLGAGVIGSSIRYSRKLYHWCINSDIGLPNQSVETDGYYQIGFVAYLMLRPLFAAAFSLFVVVAIRAGLLVVTLTANPPDKGLFYVAPLISFAVGFSSGTMLDSLEKAARKVIDGMLRTTNSE